jgi:hypothetical protein
MADAQWLVAQESKACWFEPLLLHQIGMGKALGSGFRIWIQTQSDPDPDPVGSGTRSSRIRTFFLQGMHAQFSRSCIRVGIQSSIEHIVKTKILLLI